MTSPQTTESTTALPHERVEPKDTASAPFVARHIGPRPADVEHMLQTLGYDSLEALSLIHISEPTRRHHVSRMPSSA